MPRMTKTQRRALVQRYLVLDRRLERLQTLGDRALEPIHRGPGRVLYRSELRRLRIDRAWTETLGARSEVWDTARALFGLESSGAYLDVMRAKAGTGQAGGVRKAVPA